MAKDIENRRATELETEIAYEQKTIGELNKIVREHSEAIEELKAEVQLLGRQILSLTENEAGPI
jgi:uncharacterized coiled-coil protein SlyX